MTGAPPPVVVWGITCGGPDLTERVRAALDAGIDRVILREETLPVDVDAILHEFADRVSLHQATPGAVDRAARFDCGLHLPSTCPVEEWQARWPGFLSSSVHSVDECRIAAAVGLNAVVLAPIWAPTSKPGDTRIPLGPSELSKAAEALAEAPGRRSGHRTQLIALGGITPARVHDCRASGADGIAVLGGIFGAGIDTVAAVRAYRTRGPIQQHI